MRKAVISILLIWSCFTWLGAGTVRSTANPCPRNLPYMITDVLNHRIVLFGGDVRNFAGLLRYFNDVWVLDPDTETWELLNTAGTPPSPARTFMFVGYDPIGQQMIVFGGWRDDQYFNDVWSLDLTSGSENWSQLTCSGTPPSPRMSSGIIDPLNNRVIIFGGWDQSGVRNDLWELDLSTLAWSELSPSGNIPSARHAYSAIYDSFQHRMILYAGAIPNAPMVNDVWQLDLTFGSETWLQLYPGGTGPDKRARHFAILDPVGYDMVIGFGFDYAPPVILYNDIWALDLDSLSWHQITLQGPYVVGRRETAAAYDPWHEQIFAFGGNECASYMGDTYVINTDTLAIHETDQIITSIPPGIELLSNPSRLPCKFNVFVPTHGEITINIIDITGRVIKTLVENRTSSGNYIIEWDGIDMQGRKVPVGTYFIHLEIDGESMSQKVIVFE